MRPRRLLLSVAGAWLGLGLLVVPVRAGLVAHWTLDDGAADDAATTAVNSGSLGSVADGALQHDTPVTGDWVTDDLPPGPGGNLAALRFDGTNDFVETPNWKGIGGSSDRTVMAWIRTTAKDDDIVSWGQAATAEKWIFKTTSAGVLRVEVQGSGSNATTNVADGQWHHVAAVFADDGSPNIADVQFYIDGVLDPVSAPGNTPVNTDVSDGIRLCLKTRDRRRIVGTAG